MRKVVFICFIVISALSACVKTPSYPIEPHIEFKASSSAVVQTGTVDTFTISFTDGDGDIGVDPSSNDTCNDHICGLKHGDSTCLHDNGHNIFLIDNRDTCLSFFASGNVESGGKYKDVSGDILIMPTINSKKCFAPPCLVNDTVVYTILLRDRAGHFSNGVLTTPVIITN